MAFRRFRHTNSGVVGIPPTKICADQNHLKMVLSSRSTKISLSSFRRKSHSYYDCNLHESRGEPVSDTSRVYKDHGSWWRHQMETFSALLAICAGNSTVSGEFPTQKPVTPRSFDVFFDLRLNERLSKQSWGWRFETPSRPLWRHSNALLE